MGYSVCYTIENASIARENFASAIAAINKMFEPEEMRKNMPDYRKNVTHYSWLDEGTRDHQDIKTAIEEWGFRCVLLCQGLDAERLEIESFSHDKAGDEEILLQVLGPFLNPKAVFLGQGQDGDTWRYVICNGEMAYQKGRVIFD